MSEMNITDKTIAEAIIRSAVIEYHDDELKLLEDDATPVFFSEAHEKRMRRLFAIAKTRRVTKRIWVFTKKAVTAAAFLIALISGMLLFNPGVRAAVMETVAEIFEQFTSFSFSGNTYTQDEYIEWELGWIPEHFEEIYKEYDTGTSRAGYTNLDGVNIRFTASPADDTQINVDNEHSEYSVTVKDSIEYHIFTSASEEAPSVIIWSQIGYSFVITAYIDVETLATIAYSVQEVSN